MIKDPYIKAEGFINMVTSYSGVGQKENASKMLVHALEAADEIIDAWERDATLSEAAVMAAELGQVDQAIEIVGAIGNAQLRDEGLREIAVKVAAAGHYERALNVIRMIETPYYRAAALNEVGAEFMGSGLKISGKIKMILHEMVEEASFP